MRMGSTRTRVDVHRDTPDGTVRRVSTRAMTNPVRTGPHVTTRTPATSVSVQWASPGHSAR